MSKIKYVVGFAFDKKKENVVLIKKLKPTWQAGRLNGIGGKIEPNETPLSAMVREFEEETGVHIEAKFWKQFAFMQGKTWDCVVFRAFNDRIVLARTMEKEEVAVFPVDLCRLFSPTQVIANLTWLIPMACDEEPAGAILQYNY